MPLHPKDRGWAHPKYDEPEKKHGEIIICYHQLERYVRVLMSGVRVDISKEDFDDLLPDLQKYKQTPDGDYYLFKRDLL